MPLVSVITPTYNAEAWIGRAIRSVLAQTMGDLEMIIVDDGSTDGTTEVIRSIRDDRKDDRVRMLTQKNQERSAARNAAMAVATGEYFAFLDADDWWVPEKLERQLALFKANDALGLVYCGMQQVSPDGGPLRLVHVYSGDDASGARDLARSLFSNIFGPSSVLLMPRHVVRKIGEFRTDLRYGEDWDFCLRVAEQYEVGFVPDILAYYQTHGAYMPDKFFKMNMPEKLVQVISDGIERSGMDVNSRLARQALANAYFKGALILSGIADYAEANERYSHAIALDPEDYTGSNTSIGQWIGYQANSLYDSLTPIDEAVQYVTALFDNLDGPATALSSERRAALGWACALHAFEGITLNRPERVRESFWRAIAYDPRWLRNLGLVSRGVKSYLPAR